MNLPCDSEASSTRASGRRPGTMRACGIERFGPPEVLRLRVIERPLPGPGQLLVRVRAAGVGPWDAWVRAGKSARVRAEDLPVTLGSDFSGTVEAVGPTVTSMAVGDEIYGVPNASFTGGYAEFAVVQRAMIAHKPRSLSFAQAASMPVVACTAWQMLFEQAAVQKGHRVLVLGASGSVGAFAVQLARWHGAHVIATGSAAEGGRLRELGAQSVVDVRAAPEDLACGPFDVVIDTVGGELQARAMRALGPGGVLVSIVSEPDAMLAREVGARTAFFIVDVNAACLSRLAGLVDVGELVTHVGTEIRLSDARVAHEMLDGLVPRPPGKIVLIMSGAEPRS